MTTKLPLADKALGQHFLKDQNVIAKICSDFHERASSIIEIGPGPAILTKHLSKLNLPLKVIEMDQRFIPNLKEYLSDDKIILDDALEFDLNQITIPNTWLVSNLPYNISVPLFLKFTKHENIKYMTLMFQKEVGEKLIERPHLKNTMNSLLAISQNFFNSKLLIKVSPGAFLPPPKVDSIVISFERKGTPEIPLSEFNQFEKFLRIIFANKRKMLNKALNLYPNLEDIDLSKRAEALDFNTIIYIYKKILQYL